MTIKPHVRVVVREDDKWIANAEKNKKWEPGEGFFKDNSAEKIAAGAKSGHNGDVGAAVKALNFAINRNSGQSDELKIKIRKAMEILQGEERKSKGESFKKPLVGYRYEYVSPGHHGYLVRVLETDGRTHTCEVLEPVPGEPFTMDDIIDVVPDRVGEGFNPVPDEPEEEVELMTLESAGRQFERVLRSCGLYEQAEEVKSIYTRSRLSL